MKIDGGCHCGDITFEAEADPANTSICHCTDCQQLTGTAFRTSIRAAARHVQDPHRRARDLCEDRRERQQARAGVLSALRFADLCDVA